MLAAKKGDSPQKCGEKPSRENRLATDKAPSRIARIPGQARRHFSRGEKCVWVLHMPAMQSPVRTRVAYVAAVACVVFLLGLAVSTGRAQSGEPEAPWQAHPNEGKQVPPPDTPCDGDGSCGIGRGHTCAAAHGEERSDEECNVATDWLRMFEPCGQLSFHGEYLAWWTKSTNYPALVTTNTGTIPSYADAGTLPGATILYSGGDGDAGLHSGARLGLGYWFTPCHETGFDVTYTFLANTDATFTRSNTDNSVLAMPFSDVDPTASKQDAWIIAYPGVQLGAITIHNTQELKFLEALMRCSIVQERNRNLDFVFGYRYGRFAEGLEIDSLTRYISSVGPFPVGTVIQKSDLFDARNEFNGFEMGFVSTTRYCRWSLDVLTKLAVGNTHSRVNVSGTTSLNNSPPNANGSGGLFALPSNSGIVERNGLSVIPELGLDLGYDLTSRLKATFGYTFVYWSGVMRPGDQIDTSINRSQVPPNPTPSGIALPGSKSVITDFWAQGLNLGLDYRY